MLSYKSSQSNANFLRSKHSRISADQILESTAILIDLIDKTDIANLIAEKTLIEFLQKLIELIKAGAKIDELNHNNALAFLTDYYGNMVRDFFQSRPNQMEKQIGHSIDPFLFLLDAMSSSRDADCQLCAIQSNFHVFLQYTLQNSKEPYILEMIIKITFNFVFEKPLTANLFNYQDMIKRLYTDIYSNFFCINSKPGEYIAYREEDKLLVIQKIVIPAFELVLALLVCNSAQMSELENQVYKLIVTVTYILQNKRSESDEKLYLYQLDMMLYQLDYILTNAQKGITDRFSTVSILSSVLNCMKYGENITIKALKCLEKYANIFAGAFFIIREDSFSQFRPDVNNIEMIKRYCVVWQNCIKSILGQNTPSKGRAQSARIFLQKNSIDIPKFLSQVDNKEDDFEYQKIISFTFICFANYNDDNTLNSIITAEPNIIEKINIVLDERNPDELLIVATAINNILGFYNKNGMNNPIIKANLAAYHDNLLEGLNEIRASIENPNPNEVGILDATLHGIFETIQQYEF